MSGRAGARCRARRASPRPGGASPSSGSRGSRARRRRRARRGRRRTAPPGPGRRTRRRRRARAAGGCACCARRRRRRRRSARRSRAGTSPFAARSSVLLPEPDSPTTSRISPGATSRSTSRSDGPGASGYANDTPGTRSRSRLTALTVVPILVVPSQRPISAATGSTGRRRRAGERSSGARRPSEREHGQHVQRRPAQRARRPREAAVAGERESTRARPAWRAHAAITRVGRRGSSRRGR